MKSYCIKVTVDLRGCLPGNLSYARRFRENHRKVYITAKLIKHRIWKIQYFWISFYWYCTQAFKRKTDKVCLSELPAFALVRTAKQTTLCQSGDDGLPKSVRFLRYSYWLLRKSNLKSAHWIFSDSRYTRKRNRRNISNIEKSSHTFNALITENILAKFCKNTTNWHTLLIRLKRGNTRKKEARVFGSNHFTPHQSTHVNKVMPPTNEIQPRSPGAPVYWNAWEMFIFVI